MASRPIAAGVFVVTSSVVGVGGAVLSLLAGRIAELGIGVAVSVPISVSTLVLSSRRLARAAEAPRVDVTMPPAALLRRQAKNAAIGQVLAFGALLVVLAVTEPSMSALLSGLMLGVLIPAVVDYRRITRGEELLQGAYLVRLRPREYAYSHAQAGRPT